MDPQIQAQIVAYGVQAGIDRLASMGVFNQGAPPAPFGVFPAPDGAPQGNDARTAAIAGVMALLGNRFLKPSQEPDPGWPGTAAFDHTLAVGANAGAGSTIAVLVPNTGGVNTRRRFAFTLTHAGAPAVGAQATITLLTPLSVQNGQLPYASIQPLNANAGAEGPSIMAVLDATGNTVTGWSVRAAVAPGVAASTFIVYLGDQD